LFVAGFLTFWLCGWAVGERFALWALAAALAKLEASGRLGPWIARRINKE
jgi:sugar/nucleoside kinase (ribokinase family)